MIDPVAARVWFYRALFLALCLALVFLRLLPMEHAPGALPTPDLMLCLTMAIVLRRPEFAPPVLIAAVFLLADFLFQQPPGLRSAIIVLAAEFLRVQAHRLRDLSFPFEWVTVAGAVIAVTLAERLALAVSFTPQPPLGPVLVFAVTTILAYPFVVLVTNTLLRVRKVSPGEADMLGHRL